MNNASVIAEAVKAAATKIATTVDTQRRGTILPVKPQIQQLRNALALLEREVVA